MVKSPRPGSQLIVTMSVIGIDYVLSLLLFEHLLQQSSGQNDVPDRATVPMPALIVKAAGASYPGPAANEYLCLNAARKAGISTPDFALSNDGQLLVLDRFDLLEQEDGRMELLRFEDMAMLPSFRVRDTLSDRKYQGSYQAVVELLKQHQLPREDPRRFFEQVAVSVMVHHGDSHLKNFGLLYRSATDAWLAPM